MEEHLTVLPDLSTLILLSDASGAVLAGNAPPFEAPLGWTDMPAADLGLLIGQSYRVCGAILGADRLMVGSNRADLHEVGEIVLGALGWGWLAVLALGAGAAIAADVQVRMAAMEAASGRLAASDLTARMPEHGHSDLAQLARTIKGAIARLKGLVEGMRQVSTDIAHELRMPLGRLRLRIKDAAAQTPGGSPLAQDLAAVLEESDAVDATFASLLRIAQIEAGARRDHFAPLDLAGVLDRIVEAYGSVAEDAGQTLALAASDLCPVQGDRDLLVQPFANLVENAIRHGAPDSAITLSIRLENGHATATERDTGPGIPAAERTGVLRLLYRLEASRTSRYRVGPRPRQGDRRSARRRAVLG